ncbi:MAG: dephospho-CoA kinase [Betaproteobacteria bacterium]|nr:dephospho-CoA kinase [Betaproteobacteria bacterium]
MNEARQEIPFVGLTGGIASGKSLASAEFASLGIAIVDADDIGHELLGKPGQAASQIGREFGAEYITANGHVDRDALRGIVFTDEGVRRRLESIMHPLIEKECIRQMKTSEGIYGLLVAPLLFETEFLLERLERVLLIDVDRDIQMQRGIKRGKFTEKQLQAAIEAQMGTEDRRHCADDVILNNGTSDQLRELVRKQHEQYALLFAR